MFTSRSGRCDFSPSNTRSRVGNTEILPQDVDCFLGSEGDGYDFSNLQVVLQSNHIGPDSPLSSLASSVFLP